MALHQSGEDYLEAILMLQKEKGVVRSVDVFANEYKAKEVLDKYCSFMPVPIFVTNEDAGEQTEEIPEEEVTEKDTVLDTFIKDAVTEEVEKEDGTKETVEKVPAKKKIGRASCRERV